MNTNGKISSTSPFGADDRAAGLLLHVTSLPGPFGIGDLGPMAYRWIDRLSAAGQSWWQSLPLGPTGYGNSPYQSLSSFAGNWLLISPDELIEEGLLDECAKLQAEETIDYKEVIPFKLDLLERVAANFRSRASAELKAAYDTFCQQADWLEDYALFRALKARFAGAHYLEWPRELVERRASALARARSELARELEQVRLAQFLVFQQGDRLKEYAHSHGIRLIGDLPFFVSPDSADVWAHPEFFQLDESLKPRFVGGVPPDYFSADGQLWGNPVYDWEALRQTGFRWWIDRARALLAHVDLVRLDHFRGFSAAWHVPADAPTARSGHWTPGPAAELFAATLRELGRLPFIAEDLGIITPDVAILRDEFQIPGTRVLQFAFDGNPTNPHLPRNYPANCVAYTGTHDNNTTCGWWDELPPRERQKVRDYLKEQVTESHAAVRSLIRLTWSSEAALVLAPFQDIVGLGAEARMNVPGRADGNWRWRATEEMFLPANFDWLSALTQMTHRSQVTALRGLAAAATSQENL